MHIETDSPQLTVLSRIHSGSNLVYHCADEQGKHWVYKPVLGERPLSDFPEGTLAAREVAAYMVSQTLGWELVPRTVMASGPGGVGMAQQWITENLSATSTPVQVHALSQVPVSHMPVLRGSDSTGTEVVLAHSSELLVRRIALFDFVINNADRKGGHLLNDIDGRIWAIDHGLSFHCEPKLRTVLWGWAGQSVNASDLEDLRGLYCHMHSEDPLFQRLEELLSVREVDALHTRLSTLIASGQYPVPDTRYPLPWPLF